MRAWGVLTTWTIFGWLVTLPALAFQIGPMGSRFESRLTNESNSSLASVAGRLGVLLKGPIHEEITQLGFGCPAGQAELRSDASCSGPDMGFASPYVIYGVRWNDLPPFRLKESEGNCSYLGQKACNVSQTIRFSTQPLCWYCLFKDAEKKAQSRRITGCSKDNGVIHGNVMTRSHFGDLQFLHGMASDEGTPAEDTRRRILEWLEFAWKVSTREIKPDEMLRDIKIPTINEHFGCTEWRVMDLYILGRLDAKSGLLPRLNEIAFGSVLHTVQDSFAAAHTSRETVASNEVCPGSVFERPARVVEFHTYGAQDGVLHDEQDGRDALTARSSADRWPDAVVATRNLFSLRDGGAKWPEAEPYLSCLFDLASGATASSPGESYRRR